MITVRKVGVSGYIVASLALAVTTAPLFAQRAPGESMRIPLFLTPTDDPEAWRSMLATQDQVMSEGVGYAIQKALDAQAAIKGWKTKYSSGQLTFQSLLANDVHMAGGPMPVPQP